MTWLSNFGESSRTPVFVQGLDAEMKRTEYATLPAADAMEPHDARHSGHMDDPESITNG